MTDTAETTEVKKTGFAIKKNLPEPSQSESQVEVQVSDPIVSSGLNKFVTYKIQGSDAEGPFDVQRRYSDFDKVREALVNNWPSCFIAPLPPKKKTGNFEAQFIEERRRQLDFWLNRISKKSFIWYSEEMKCLTRGFGDVEKTLKNLPKQSLDGMINKYEETFKHLAEKEINTEIIVKISTFQQYLKKINQCLKNFKTMSDNMIDVQNKHNEMFKTFFNFMLPEYEKNCLTEYTNGQSEKFIFNANENEKFNEVLSNMKEFTQRQEFFKFIDLIALEQHEIDAFNQCFKKRDEYEQKKNKSNSALKEAEIEMQKIMAGKGGNILNKKPKEQMIEETQKKIDSLKTENEQINFVCDLMTVILGHCEIDSFKEEKQNIYYSTMKQLAQFETEFAKAKIEMWEQVLENSNINVQE